MRIFIGVIFVVALIFAGNPNVLAAQEETPNIIDQITNASPDQLSSGVMIVLVLAILSLAPALVIMVTSFLRIIVVLAFTRTALATQQMPPNQVLVGLALFLTMFIMAPTFSKIYDDAYTPYIEGLITSEELFTRGLQPIRQFMLENMQTEDSQESIALFIKLGNLERPKTVEELPTYVIIPAFMISELKRAFTIGVFVFIPFIIIDIAIASILLSMGLIFLPPVLISLPFKIVLFVIIDGWNLLIESLVSGFRF